MAFIALDWNGTILDDTAAWAKAYNAALNVLGIPEQPLAALQDNYDTPAQKAILNFGVTEDVLRQRSAEMFAAFAATLALETEHAGLRPGALEMLTGIGALGHTGFLLSNHTESELLADIHRHGLVEAFAHVSGRKHIQEIRTKSTKADRLLSFMAEKEIEPRNVVIIGDAREEARIARDYNLVSICITGGYSSRRRLEEDGAHYIVDDLREIPPLLARLYDMPPP